MVSADLLPHAGTRSRGRFASRIASRLRISRGKIFTDERAFPFSLYPSISLPRLRWVWLGRTPLISSQGLDLFG